jgi:hypothetical protein
VPRRLPVIQNSAVEDEVAASRPRWHWVLIGTGLTVTLWGPLVVVGGPVGLRLAAHFLGVPAADLASSTVRLSPRDVSVVGLVVAGALVLGFAFAAFAAGALVGRFGGSAGPAQAALGAALAAALASGLGPALSNGISAFPALSAFVALAVAGTLGALLGGVFGFRKRPC